MAPPKEIICFFFGTQVCTISIRIIFHPAWPQPCWYCLPGTLWNRTPKNTINPNEPGWGGSCDYWHWWAGSGSQWAWGFGQVNPQAQIRAQGKGRSKKKAKEGVRPFSFWGVHWPWLQWHVSFWFKILNDPEPKFLLLQIKFVQELQEPSSQCSKVLLW